MCFSEKPTLLRSVFFSIVTESDIKNHPFPDDFCVMVLCALYVRGTRTLVRVFCVKRYRITFTEVFVRHTYKRR